MFMFPILLWPHIFLVARRIETKRNYRIRDQSPLTATVGVERSKSDKLFWRFAPGKTEKAIAN
jgi:hypothetical protein